MYPIIQRLGRAKLDKLLQGIKKYPLAFSQGVSFFAPNRMMALVNYDKHYNEISSAIKTLKDNGVEVHINVGSTIGHSDGGVGGEPLSVPTMVDSKGGGCIASACPRSEDFKRLLGESIEDYAKLSPKSILIDDDFSSLGYGKEFDLPKITSFTTAIVKLKK